MSSLEQEEGLMKSLFYAMASKMKGNRYKLYWADSSVPMLTLVSSLLEEASELVDAVASDDPRFTKADVWVKAGDVASLAAMIASHNEANGRST